MSQVTDTAVRDFVKNELPLVTTLFLKKVDVDDQFALQELHEADDLAEMAAKYFSRFNVQSAPFSLENYFPWKTPTLLCRKPINQDKKPLTINMFIESARAGKWLYG
ncbi:hypothetical protein NG99_01125 [Erwinia typographi]|uniref:Acyl carrier protein n=1 Tax=Erwinia typographi TaxID=371042 RepID=A0A0A3Z9K5_9GAMM|nr:DUF1493 family protein [Erwinia typographi]KGT95777.1 hypothetical protein NG99_01125 [Erwinia typographi]